MEWHTMDAAAAVKALKTDPNRGLNEQQVQQRLRQYGENRLQAQKKNSLLRKFFAQFQDFMVIVLLVAAGISFLVSRLRGDGEYIDSVIILIIVMVNAILGCVQEYRAEKAIEALKRITSPHATVLREGRKKLVDSAQIVPGDLIVLSTGDLVPCDLRLTQTLELQTEESALTGESVPSEKRADCLCQADAAIADRACMAFCGTTVVNGHGIGIAVQTGMSTQLGRIATMLQREQAPQTPLQLRLEKMGKALGIGALSICGVIFLLGLLQRVEPLEMFLISVSLAVAAIPEGMTAVVTVVLAMGVRRMAQKRAIVRKLPAVETLGSTSVICSDKTGTLTQNKMTVTKVCLPTGEAELSSAQAQTLLQMASLCTNCTVLSDGSISGPPTEAAIVSAVQDRQRLLQQEKEFPRAGEIPFSSERKRMSTVHRTSTGYRVITKGAPDLLLSRCSLAVGPAGAVKLTPALKEKILEQNAALANGALRVIGVAMRELTALEANDEATESELLFCGLIGMLDPPRPQAKQAVALCKSAGILPIMITGDHSATAQAIAKELGICQFPAQVISGRQLDTLSMADLEKEIGNYRVFARVSPAHKVRIVKAFQANGHIVAMTGDGVNDAPALKAADIGCAMGKNGTEAAKAAADMVLTDDNFATIVEAVREGRGIFKNIRKAIHFLISCNIGEILVVFAAFLLGLPTPLLAIQLLWVNLVTDSLPALALGVDPIDKNVMEEKPAGGGNSFFSKYERFSVGVEGCLIGALALLAYSVGRVFFDADPADPFIGRTMAFAVLSLSQLVHAYNMRSEGSVLAAGLFKNKKLVLATAFCAVLMIAVVAVPALCVIFKTARLNALQWVIVSLLSVFPLFISETEKLLRRHFARTPRRQRARP